MTKTNFSERVYLDLSLERQGKTPLYQQIVSGLRAMILSGTLLAGARLPASRKLAETLGVSRVTVVTALEQLAAEGYVTSRRGAGAFVASDLPDRILQAGKSGRPAVQTGTPPARVMPRPFSPAGPDMRLFPHANWARLMQRVWARPGDDLLVEPAAAGHWELRREIAAHLYNWRAIQCSPEQVFVTSGSVESIQILLAALFEKDQFIAIEDPSYEPVRKTLLERGMKLVAIDVDNAGMDISWLNSRAQQARAVLITPSRQFPLGMTMPLGRRLALLGWAAAGRYILEDDYDSEYRYHGQPLPALMSLDRHDSVIYLGSFSKIFSKSLRLSYFVVPAPLARQVNETITCTGTMASFLAQPVLARFMASGDFAAHIRRMRRLYGRRQTALKRAFDAHLADWLKLSGEDAGLHMTAILKQAGPADVVMAQRAAQAGVMLQPLSQFYIQKAVKQGFVLGFAAYDEKQLDAAARQLAMVLEGKL